MPFDWVVVGCETGPGARECKLEWIESVVTQCRNAGIPIFVKQINLGGKIIRDVEKFPKNLQIRQVPWSIYFEQKNYELLKKRGEK
jgi:protein gp37